MPVVASGVKPSQFYSDQHDVLYMDDIPDVKHHQVGGPGVVEQAECRQLPEIRSWTKTIGTDGSVVVDDHDQFDSRAGLIVVGVKMMMR